MKRQGVLSALVVIITLAAIHWGSTPMAWAESSFNRQMVVVVVDGEAVRLSEQGGSLTKSFLGLVAMLQDEQSLTFISADNPSDKVGPFGVSSPDFNAVQDEVEARLISRGEQQIGDLAEAIVEAYAVLGANKAAPGSTVYVISGASPDADFNRLFLRLTPLADRFQQQEWPINGVSLPGASAGAIEFLGRLSNSTAGHVFELSISDGFRELADAILSQGAMGSLTLVGRRALTPSEVMTAVVSVAPGTGQTTMLFSKESPYGSLRLSNPSGFEVSAGDRTSSYVVETPHVVVWRLTDPAPGNWRIDARGMEGLISAWEYSSNKYSLALGSEGPLPLNQPSALMAYVKEGGQVVALEGVRLFANISAPDGATLVQEMKDDGAGGDAEAGDGYFSAILPPLRSEGSYTVELELSWLEYNHRISSHGVFDAQPFPEIVVEPVELEGVQPGERTKVATVLVHVQGEPYPVDADNLGALMTSPGSQEGIVELQPRRLYGDGPAWEYDVFLTAQEGGVHSLAFQLILEYAGRMYSQASDPLLVSSVVPPSVAESELVSSPDEPAVPAAAPPQNQPLGRPRIQIVEPSRFPWPVLAFSLLGLAGVAVTGLYLLTRTRPYGYLLDDSDETLVDFAGLKRHPIWGVLFQGTVRGHQLNIPGLEGVTFQFSKTRLRLRKLREYPTVRVNNEPLIGRTTIDDQTWIGTGGKLYTFMLSPTPAAEGASAD